MGLMGRLAANASNRDGKFIFIWMDAWGNAGRW